MEKRRKRKSKSLENYLDFILTDIKEGASYEHPHFYLFENKTKLSSLTEIPKTFSNHLNEKYGSSEKEVKLIWEEFKLYIEDFSGYGGAVNREMISRMEKDAEEETENIVKTSPEKGIVAPSSIVINNVCEREKFCNAQGKITFGQLARLIKAAKTRKIGTDVGSGVYKSLIRLLPWFIPQIAIGAFIGSGLRAVNKIIKPALETTKGYKSFWGRAVMNILNYAEGELPITDPLSKIFFVSDGLLELMDERHKIKFSRYIAELADSKNESEEVPEYFVENELRDWINQKFLIDPPLKPKTY
tara:strand:- start:556 stop:1458 length:903 start_codon:yes stop_codon:yes gene_type:complete